MVMAGRDNDTPPPAGSSGDGDDGENTETDSLADYVDGIEQKEEDGEAALVSAPDASHRAEGVDGSNDSTMATGGGLVARNDDDGDDAVERRKSRLTERRVQDYEERVQRKMSEGATAEGGAAEGNADVAIDGRRNNDGGSSSDATNVDAIGRIEERIQRKMGGGATEGAADNTNYGRRENDGGGGGSSNEKDTDASGGVRRSQPTSPAPSSDDHERGAHHATGRPAGFSTMNYRLRQMSRNLRLRDRATAATCDEEDADVVRVDEEGLVSACLVDNDDVVVEAEPLEKRLTVKRASFYGGIALAVLATVVGLSVGLSVGLTRDGDDDDARVVSEGALPTPAPTYDPRPTLERIAEENILTCGIRNETGFGKWNHTTGEAEGFAVDLCRAVAAAALSSAAYAIQTVYVTASDRWEALANRTIDLLIGGDTHTMERDVHEPTTGLGFSFTVPYFYDGLRLGGLPHFIKCAGNRTRTGNCSDLQICVIAGTTHYDVLSNWVPGYLFESVGSTSDLHRSLTEETCNVIAGEFLGTSPEVVRDGGYYGLYNVSKRTFTKEPLAMVTRDDDTDFSEFVNLVLQSLISAESENVTQKYPSAYANFSFLGGQYENMLVNAISAAGNLREVYDRHLQDILPRTVGNEINRGGSGLIYSHPFGLQNNGPEQVPNGTLDTIMQRGWLRCGVPTQNDLSGLDEEYCRAIAAGIFADVGAVDLKGVDSDGGGFKALETGEVDVLSGTSMRLSADNGMQHRSNNTGEGFLYSQPYFYFPVSGKNSSTNYRALATRQDDMQWFGVVYWVVSATFFAEENRISQDQFYRMPLVRVFGPEFNWLFRDVIDRVGNYGEIYKRNVNESLFPRNGSRNQLNSNTSGPQHFPLDGF